MLCIREMISASPSNLGCGVTSEGTWTEEESWKQLRRTIIYLFPELNWAHPSARLKNVLHNPLAAKIACGGHCPMLKCTIAGISATFLCVSRPDRHSGSTATFSLPIRTSSNMAQSTHNARMELAIADLANQDKPNYMATARKIHGSGLVPPCASDISAKPSLSKLQLLNIANDSLSYKKRPLSSISIA